MDGYNNSTPSKWSSFKREFNHDMEEFGKAFKAVTINNVK